MLYGLQHKKRKSGQNWPKKHKENMVADLHFNKNEEIRKVARMKHAIACFIDTQCELIVYEHTIEIRGKTPKGVGFSHQRENLHELYAWVEYTIGSMVLNWFDKNTIKSQIYCTMNYLMQHEGLRFNLAIHKAYLQIKEEYEWKASTLAEAFKEYIADIEKNLQSVDNFNFPDNG